jgi:hypothetical protein
MTKTYPLAPWPHCISNPYSGFLLSINPESINKENTNDGKMIRKIIKILRSL